MAEQSTTPDHAAALALLDKITPGEWDAVPSAPEEGFECFWLRASVPFGPPTRGNKIVDFGYVNGPQSGEQLANARAIAALPELAALYRAGVEMRRLEGEITRHSLADSGEKIVRVVGRCVAATEAFDAALAAVAEKLTKGEGK